MVELVATLDEWRDRAEALRRSGRSLGLTMTMGALHAGHSSLFDRGASECDASLATIFVNPLQFGDAADLDRYEVDLDADLALCDAHGVDLVLAPSRSEVWPSWPDATATTVSVAGPALRFEGADRPGHFDGVATVVAKLLGVTGACTAYFGEKDYQQLCVVRRLVADLALAANVVGCPIVRDADGLALSSRNARLTARGRVAATVLHRALVAGVSCIEGGDVTTAVDVVRRVASEESSVQLAYAAIVEPSTMRPLDAAAVGAEVRVIIAALLEGVRLLDNAPAVVGSRA